MRSMQYQLGTWEPSQHLLKDRGKPRKPVSRWPAHLNIIQEFSPYLKENATCAHYKDQFLNAVQGNNRCLLLRVIRNP
jgi:hypothetical protein